MGIREINTNEIRFEDSSDVINIDNKQNEDEYSTSETVVNFIDVPKIELSNFTYTQPDTDTIDNLDEMDTNFHNENDTNDDKSECSINEINFTEILNLDGELKPEVVNIIQEEEVSKVIIENRNEYSLD